MTVSPPPGGATASSLEAAPAGARADLTLPTSTATVPVRVLEHITLRDGTQALRCVVELWEPVEQIIPADRNRPIDSQDYGALPER
jgi:hypothetical protein